MMRKEEMKQEKTGEEKMKGREERMRKEGKEMRRGRSEGEEDTETI